MDLSTVFRGVFGASKTRPFFRIEMAFFAQKSKVQYFISTIKPIFQHFINIAHKSNKNQFTIRVLQCKKIFTFKNFTKFYLFQPPQAIDFQYFEFFRSIQNNRKDIFKIVPIDHRQTANGHQLMSTD